MCSVRNRYLFQYPLSGYPPDTWVPGYLDTWVRGQCSLPAPCWLWEYCTLDSFVDFGAVYIICLFTLYALPLIFFLRFFLLIFSCENRPALVSRPEVVRGDQTWDFFSCFQFILYYGIFVFLMHDYLCSVSLGVLCVFVVISCFFYFCFFSTSQEIGWEEHVRNDQFCVEWDVKP